MADTFTDILKKKKKDLNAPMSSPDPNLNTPMPEINQPQVPENNVNSIKFNSDKSVTVDGINMSPEEYKTFNDKRKRGSSFSLAPGDVKQKQVFSNRLESMKNRIRQEMNLPVIPPVEQSMIDLPASQEVTQPQGEELTKPSTSEAKKKSMTLMSVSDYLIGAPFQNVGDVYSALNTGQTPERLKSRLSPIAEAWDFVNSIFKDGKGVQLRDAEKAYEKIEADLKADISLVATGDKDPLDVKRKFVQLQELNNLIEMETKKLGLYNVLTKDTAGVLRQVDNNRDNLGDYYIQLNNAVVKSQTNMVNQNAQQEAQIEAEAKKRLGIS